MKKKYDTVAVCNALVDVEIKVTEEELQSLPYPKSSMTLVEAEESHALLERFKDKRKKYSSGGSVGNTIYALARFGVRTGVMVNVGNDDFGRKYRQEYQKVGVDFLGKMRDKTTGVCLVLITPDTARTMVTTLGCAADFTEEIVEETCSLSTKSVYVESYLLFNEKNIRLLTEMIDRLKKLGRKVILSDSDWFAVKRSPETYSRLFKKMDIFFCNADQLRAMSGYKHEDTIDVERYFHRYAVRKSRPHLLVVTDSEHGAYLSRIEGRKTRIVHVPAVKVKVVDSNGAGDGFSAGVLTEYFKGSSITRMGNRGAQVAAHVISRFGARYP